MRTDMIVVILPRRNVKNRTSKGLIFRVNLLTGTSLNWHFPTDTSPNWHFLQIFANQLPVHRLINLFFY